MKRFRSALTSFFTFSLVCLLQLPLFGYFLPQTVAAQTGGVTPQFNCLAASCPNQTGSPTPQVTATTSSSSSQFNTSPCSSSSLSSLQFSAQHPSQRQSNDQGSRRNDNNRNNQTSSSFGGGSDRGGFLEGFFQFFLALIQLILQTGGTRGISPCSPTVSVPPVASVSAAPIASPSGTPATSSAQPTVVKNVEKTSNWAGYAIQSSPSVNGSITTNWNITKMDCSAGKGHASSWPGMGGRQNDPNISQVGTAEICVADTTGVLAPSYYGWTESFPNPVAPLDSTKYPVAIGDQFSAIITFQGSGKFATTLTNKTQGWTLNTPMSFAASYIPKSSEVITESSDQYPIVPKFDTINYPGNIYSPDGTKKVPLGSAQNLVKVTNNSASGTLRTDASPITGDTFNTPWTHN